MNLPVEFQNSRITSISYLDGALEGVYPSRIRSFNTILKIPNEKSEIVNDKIT